MAPVPLGAGAARADADAVILQNIDGILHRNPGDGQRQHMGSLVAAVYGDALQGGKLFRKFPDQCPLPGKILPEGGADGGAGGGKAENRRGALGAAAVASLLAAA